MQCRLKTALRISEAPDYSELVEKLIDEYVFEADEVLETKRLTARDPRINLLPENVRNGDEAGTLSGFVTGIGTILSTTTRAYQGTHSVRFSIPDDNQYFETAPVHASPNTNYVASCYAAWFTDAVLSAPAQFTISVYSITSGGVATLIDSSEGTFSSFSYEWIRLSVAVTTPSTTAQIKIRLTQTSGSDHAAPGLHAYFDAFQLEYGTTVSDWVNPGGDDDAPMFSAVDLCAIQNTDDEVTATVTWASSSQGVNKAEVGPGKILVLPDVDPTYNLPTLAFDDASDECPGAMIIVGTT